jgi:hypothetical protein
MDILHRRGVHKSAEERRVSMRLFLMNSAVTPIDGRYTVQHTDLEGARYAVAIADEIVSYVGYPTTAQYMEKALGIPVAVNRDHLKELRHGDIMLVCRLKYRVPDPADKGKFEPGEEDFEWLIIKYEEA